MELAALAIAVVALLAALAARAKAASQALAIEDAERETRRRVDTLSEEVDAKLELTRRLLARVSSGEKLTQEMILEGQLFREVAPEDGARLVAGGARVLDVRTPRETAGGIIPGAILIPVDELEERSNELPKDGAETLVYCAGGGRSAAACDSLSRKGYDGLHNLLGGYTSWTGPTEMPR